MLHPLPGAYPVGSAADGLHHPALAEVQQGEVQPHAVGVEGGATDQMRLPPRVVHHHMAGGVVVDDQPVPRAGESIDRAAVDVAARNGDTAVDLLLQ